MCNTNTARLHDKILIYKTIKLSQHKIMAEHNEIGKMGEEIAVKYLLKQDFSIVDRNFHVKRGEIDIIGIVPEQISKNFHVKWQKLYFFEVKTKKVSSFKQISDLPYSPENNFSPEKRNRMKRAIKGYLSYKKIDESKIDVEIWLIIVFLNTNIKKAKIKVYKDIILN